MNRTFKVVFNKARGALMVANEATCSVQKKGVKTAIAVAAALAMGSSMAQGWIDAPSKEEGAVVLENVSVLSEDFEGKSQFSYTLTEGKTTGFHSATGEISADKSVWVTATGGKDAKAHAYSVYGADKQLTNHGRIYIQAGKNEAGGLLANSYSQKGMIAGKGATAINARDGLIVAKNAYGMTVETTGPASKVQNDGQIVVLEQGAGIELGGASGSTAVNNGTISVTGEMIKHDTLHFGHGVLINTSGNTFTNNGTISTAGATGEGADISAIEVKDDAKNTTVILGADSKVDGKIHFASGVTGSTLEVDGAHDTIVVKSEVSDLKLNVVGDADIELADGNASTYGEVNVSDGKLTASIWQADNKFSKVTVNEGGILNITKLNSKSNDELAENDRLLLAFGADYTLNGGKLYVDNSEYTNAIKIGTAGGDKGTGSLTISAGSYQFSKVELGSAADNALIIDGGTLTAGVFDATNGKTTVDGSGTLASNQIVFGDKATGSVTLYDGGTLRTTGENIFVKGEGEDASWDKSNFAKSGLKTGRGSGVLEITDSFDATLEEIQKAQQMFEDVVLNFSGVTITDEIIGFNEDNGLSTVNSEVQAGEVGEDGKTSLRLGANKVSGVGILKVAEGTTALDISGSGSEQAGVLVINGQANGGNVITGVDKLASITTTGDLQLGYTDGAKGVVNADSVTANGVTVSGEFQMNDLSVGDYLDVDRGASLLLNKLDGEGSASIEGTMTANVIAAAAQVENGGVLLIGARQEATTEEEPPVEGGAEVGTQMLILARVGDETGTPEAEPTYVNQVQDVVTGRIGSVTTTSAGGIAALAAAGFDSATQAGLYVDHTIGVDDATGRLEIGLTQEQGAATSAGGVQLTSDAFTVINVGALNGEAAFAANQMTNNGQIVLDDITGLGQVTLISGTTNVGGTGTVTTTSALYNAAVNAEAGNVFDIGYNTGVAGDIDGVVEGLVTNGTDVKNMNVLNAIANKNSGYVGSDGKLTSTGVQATKEYLATPVTAGTYNMAYDSAELISNALIQHNLNSKQGLGVWADVFYGSNETDTLYGNSGYSSDIYGGMIGVDYGFGEGARVGAALSIGSGDGDSEGSVSKYSTDSDFWGLSVYAGKDVGGLTFTADMSYLWLDNDISGSVAGASASESLDSTVFTLGARADWKAYEGDVMQVVPHVGVRWAQIDVDDYRGLSMDKMNVFEMPIGVTVKGNIATASGWTVTPAIDFTAAPQIGDTEVETIVGDVDVIDNVYNASIGVSAGNDAMRFGLSYKYGFGNDGRSNNTFNLKASYLF